MAFPRSGRNTACSPIGHTGVHPDGNKSRLCWSVENSGGMEKTSGDAWNASPLNNR